MSDLPQWAKGDEEGGGNTDLEDKLVDEAKHDEPESSTVEVEADEVPGRIDSGSRVLFFFRFVAALTVIMALVLIATNCYIIYKSYDDLQARGVLLRVYGILFCLFVIFAELEWGHFIKFFGFLKYWPARGIFYMFVGLITWDESDDTNDTFETYEDVVAFIMIALGALYFILGLACMRTVKEAESARLAEEAANP